MTLQSRDEQRLHCDQQGGDTNDTHLVQPEMNDGRKGYALAKHRTKHGAGVGETRSSEEHPGDQHQNKGQRHARHREQARKPALAAQTHPAQ